VLFYVWCVVYWYAKWKEDVMILNKSTFTLLPQLILVYEKPELCLILNNAIYLSLGQYVIY